MIVGRYIQRLSGLVQYSPPFPRGGQYMLLTLEVFAIIGGALTRMDVIVEHKNLADTSWSQVFPPGAAVNATGIYTLVVGPLKEQVRISYQFTSGSSPQRWDAVYMNIPPPTWMQ
jgi:hypothetical protein